MPCSCKKEAEVVNGGQRDKLPAAQFFSYGGEGVGKQRIGGAWLGHSGCHQENVQAGGLGSVPLFGWHLVEI